MVPTHAFYNFFYFKHPNLEGPHVAQLSQEILGSFCLAYKANQTPKMRNLFNCFILYRIKINCFIL